MKSRYQPKLAFKCRPVLIDESSGPCLALRQGVCLRRQGERIFSEQRT